MGYDDARGGFAWIGLALRFENRPSPKLTVVPNCRVADIDGELQVGTDAVFATSFHGQTVALSPMMAVRCGIAISAVIPASRCCPIG